jgi:hypothetical protein
MPDQNSKNCLDLDKYVSIGKKQNECQCSDDPCFLQISDQKSQYRPKGGSQQNRENDRADQCNGLNIGNVVIA